MREILFRGKTTPHLLSCRKDENGNWVQTYTESDWVYGYYAPTYLCERDGKTQNKYAIISDEFIGQPEMIGRNINTGLPKMFEIVEDTLGQYIGIKDRNGTKIFEGDIVDYVNYRRKGAMNKKTVPPFRSVVEFGRHTISCCGCCYQKHEAIGFYFDNYNEDEETFDNIEVIGNIWDNPELMPKK